MLRRGAKGIAMRHLLRLLLLLVFAPVALPAAAAPQGNQLSRREQLRYQDVVTTRDGSRWRGKVIERGDVFRVRLEDNSEVAVPKAEVVSVTRELHPGLPHRGQWQSRATVGFEVAFQTGENAGVNYGPTLEVGLGRNWGGAFEPEVSVTLSPMAPEAGTYTAQIGIGTRYYLQPFDRAKPYAATQVVVAGSYADLGLRTGGGVLLDLTPNFGVGLDQGVTLMTQGAPIAVGVGYHVGLLAQGRF